ncbi:MAG: hypothetical protein MAG715_00190 [Methanonatronarchaeales archaeon]|nr:hypothetical protein [Methanonatronarchaeales archaeon]
MAGEFGANFWANGDGGDDEDVAEETEDAPRDADDGDDTESRVESP